MGISGGCHCGAVRYEAEGRPDHFALCHCTSCRRSSGAPMVGWTLFPEDSVTITGDTVRYESSPGVGREFCGTCGTGLFYRAAPGMYGGAFDGKVDIQAATFDDPGALQPQACIQMADAPAWVGGIADLPKFDRFPPG